MNDSQIAPANRKTKVVNKYKYPFDVYIGRRAKLSFTKYDYGNPYSVKRFGREGCLEQYKQFFDYMIINDPIFKEKILELKGKILGCYCKPKKCHGDIIVEWLEAS